MYANREAMNQKNTQNSAMPRPYKLAGVVLSAVLTACGGGDGENATTVAASNSDATASVTLVAIPSQSVASQPSVNTASVASSLVAPTASGNAVDIINNTTASSAIIIPPTLATIDSIISNLSTDQRIIANYTTTGDNFPELNGMLNWPLTNLQKINVYDGATLLGVAEVNGLNWKFIPTVPLNNGEHRFTVEVMRFDGVSVSGLSQVYVINVLYTPPVVVIPPTPVTPNTPPAPAVSANDTTNTVTGYSSATMEASLNGSSWSSALPDLSGNKTLYVRTKAQGINPAGTPKLLTFTANVVADPAPIAGGAFASLADMTVSDNGGNGINNINAGGVTDPLGRPIVYSATGLPAGLSINSSTGVISGMYDASPTKKFTVTVKAQATGSNQSASKQFVLTVRDDG